MFFFPGTHFASAVAESRRKHLPLYFEMQLWADTPSQYFEAGPMTVFLTHGELNRCRKLDIDPALARRIGVGKIFRMPEGGNTRYLFKLWYTPKRGYFADPHAHADAERTAHVFAVDESQFLRWIVDRENSDMVPGMAAIAEA